MKRWDSERASRLAETERDIDSQLLVEAAKQILASGVPVASMHTRRRKDKSHKLLEIRIKLMSGGNIVFTPKP